MDGFTACRSKEQRTLGSLHGRAAKQSEDDNPKDSPSPAIGYYHPIFEPSAQRHARGRQSIAATWSKK